MVFITKLPPFPPFVVFLFSCHQQVFTGGTADLFAYHRSPEEAAAEAEATVPTAHAQHNGNAAGRGDGNSGREAFSTRGALPQILARLQLQSHINQV